ncbi:ABC transporter, ATP-binding protein [Thermogutta terrifontis]|uniref:ABC transporter, ATP-binding protein n=1 Tax=Thermogutta terrifontis TaxID=1331910 RepID=A0A286RCS1_9BACT|nr:ABC transporter ATP-binding protein [Thermogutta terrifontis]ASV73755.1 ABC transporter, ATP-binding protein [Thermogutta terrifontis]
MIELDRFTKKYGSFCAVDRVSFQVTPGEVFGFIGRNGAGKTTTIRFLATLIRATAGDGMIAGYSVTRQPREVRRHLGYVPDTFAEFPSFRVKGFLDFFARAYGVPRQIRRRRVEDLLERLGLAAYAKTDVRKLSRGLKQRLYLARALVHDPPVLILDEPTAGLDPVARMEFKSLLKEWAAEGKAILLSSHNLAELADMVTHVGIIERGRMVVSGTLREVLTKTDRRPRVRVHYLGAPDRLETTLRNLPQVRWSRTENGQVILELVESSQKGEVVFAQVLRTLVMAGIDVVEYQPLLPTLEELFMQATAGNALEESQRV